MKATRKGGTRKRRAAFVENEVSRWNCKDHPIKQVRDGMESLRVFLKNAEQVSLLEYARLMYIKHSTRPGIAVEYAAINREASLFAFIERWENADAPLTLSQVEQAVVQGFVTEVQANEINRR